MQSSPYSALIDKLLNFFYPSRCPSCGRDSSLRYYPFCKICWQGIKPFSGDRCLICSIPMPEHATICGGCLEKRPFFKVSYVYGLYEGLLKEAVHYLKYLSCRNLAKAMGELLLNLSLPEADILVPVPPDTARLKKRGFNHTALIARHISKKVGIPLELDLLIKVRQTPPQVGLRREERLKNLKGAFRVTKRLKGQKILLLDDVITTGITGHECSRALIKAGAEEVYLVAVARSAPERGNEDIDIFVSDRVI